MSKKAFVLGIGNYTNNNWNLNNPVNDAEAMAEVLTYKDFTVSLHLNTTIEELRNVFNSFLNNVIEGDTILFFYAGHAIEDRDINYILHSDIVDINKEDPLSLDEIQNNLNKKNASGIKIIILDACRTSNFFEGKALGKIKSNRNTLIAFSTSPGNIAKDGNENLSRYTKNLISCIQEYNLNIDEVFKKTRELLISETEFTQIPWEHSSLINEFSFDTIRIPKLVKIIRSFKIIYSIKSFNKTLIIGGESEFITLYTEQFDIHTQKMPFESVSEIDSNENGIVLVGEKKLCYFNKEDDYFVKELDFDCHTVSLNNDNRIFVAGESNIGIIYDFINDKNYAFDINEEVESTLSRESKRNAGQSKNFSEELSIYCSEFNLLDSNIIAFGGANHLFVLKNIRENSYIYINQNKELFDFTYSIKFSLDGKYIATAHDRGKAILWDCDTLEIIKIFQVNENIEKTEYLESDFEKIGNTIHHVEFSPDSKVMVFGTRESKLIFWDLKYKTKIGEIHLSIEPIDVYSFTYSKDGKRIIASIDDRVYFFDAQNLK